MTLLLALVLIPLLLVSTALKGEHFTWRHEHLPSVGAHFLHVYLPALCPISEGMCVCVCVCV